MGPSAPPNRLGRPGSSHYLIDDSIGVSSPYRLSCLDRSGPRTVRVAYSIMIDYYFVPPALNKGVHHATETMPHHS